MSPHLKRACGVVAGPLFVAAYTAMGATRAGYDWRRYPVSALATGKGGWLQRVNFLLTGGLYCVAADGLRRGRAAGPRAVPALVFAVGVGLIGSGVFAIDEGDEFPPGAPLEPNFSRQGMLHNLFAIPIFLGIPPAAAISAGSALRRREYRWGVYSACSGLLMAGTFRLFGVALSDGPRFSGRAGVFQRVSIVAGFGWLSALSLRR